MPPSGHYVASGRGFAVVADEVRKLAERTAKATGEITGMVAAIQNGTGRAVETMQDGVVRVQEGVVLAGAAGTSVGQIHAGATQVVGAVADISAALREQGAASTEIARNVERIAQMAEQNSAEVRETAGNRSPPRKSGPEVAERGVPLPYLRRRVSALLSALSAMPRDARPFRGIAISGT